MGAIGSSPLTRGKPLPAQGMTLEFRLIPAHAGKTGEIGCKTVIARAHPRSRGENLIPLTNPSISDGSSPLTRGKQPAFLKDLTEIRLIPAHAGKTRCLHPWTRTGTAHPRSRGENMQPATTAQIDAGSSPLTRGKHWWLTPPRSLARLIPAHAGKTDAVVRRLAVLPAHPRSRGENPLAAWLEGVCEGSSPLTRGKPALPHSVPQRPRLIPAHAGKT